MPAYVSMTRQEQITALENARKNLEACKSQKLSLNMARGKPGKKQLDLVSGILTVLTDPADCVIDGVDVRNYGELAGLPCARAYWAELLGCKPEEIFVGGASSLMMMYDIISLAYTQGLLHSPKPWCKEEKIRFLCPVPGYDRHFRILESFGVEMISIPMTQEGPDMDLVEKLVRDPAVKGIWCVPKYSNPDGIIYSQKTIERLAALQPAAPDFALMYDNAYAVHEFEGEFVAFPDILSLCRRAGRPDMVFQFASTSKITMPGSGISCIATSEANLSYLSQEFGVQMICFDKVNQLRHVRFLKDKAHTLELMKRHADILRPKFALVSDTLERELGPLGFANWNRPKGGYFISLNTMPGTAKRALALCKEAGVAMTEAGATYPYGIDPADSNIRIAPTMPPLEELEKAMDVFCTCLKIAALEKLLGEME